MKRLAGEINLLKIWRKRIKKISGTREGGLKAAKSNMAKYGEDFYKNNGRKGGMKGHTGGFASNRELARIAGQKGGRTSRRGADIQDKLENIFGLFIERQLSLGYPVHYIAERIGVSDGVIKRFAQKKGWLSGDYTKKVQ